LPIQAKPAPVLQDRRRVERQLGGVRRELAISEPLATRIDDDAVLGAARRDLDVPSLRRGAHEHVARGGAGDAQALVERRGRHRGAFFLRRRLLPERNLVGGPAGHEPDLHPLPIGVELVGEDLRQRGVRPLPDLRLRQAERDLPAGGDQDPVRDLVVGVAIALRARRPPGDRDEEGRACQRRSG